MYRMPPWVRWPRLVLVSFCIGALTDSWLAERLHREASAHGRPAAVASAAAVGTSGREGRPPSVAGPGPRQPARGAPAGDVEALRERHLSLPIDGADVDRWKGSFDEIHSGHSHQAVDILAPRGTPVRTVEAGTIAKLLTSKAGGLTVYQFDASRWHVYYYAHLDSYAAGLHDGEALGAGQVIGYVGTSGNAPPETPHLHFAIARLAPGESWWHGTAIDPYEVFGRGKVEDRR